MFPVSIFYRICIVVLLLRETVAQCPWHQDAQDLQTSCLCAYNLGQELSVQCDQVDFPQLVTALDKYASNTPLDLLYINNSTIKKLENKIFQNLQLHNFQLSSCKLKQIEDSAFFGQESHLRNLNLQDNLIEEVPVKALKSLTRLNLLDLSKNKISHIQNDAFKGLSKLSTLKLMDNNVTLARFALRGLENCLKNLNLKGTKQKKVPEAVRGLKNLAFLDLSLNGIRELPDASGTRTFEGLDSLSALNLERNLLSSLGETAFQGVSKTLSSLSLLNNLLSEFPVGAVHSLKELRVLDIGFNLLTSLPETAFRGNPAVTLLALDGNPLPTVPEKALAHLNKSLRGLSLGGRFLHCDCKLKWVAEWIRNGDLQVTSRERNPQFCGSPGKFRERGFYSIQPEELTCPDNDILLDGSIIGVIDSLVPKPFSLTPTQPTTTLFVTPSTTTIGSTSEKSQPSTIHPEISTPNRSKAFLSQNKTQISTESSNKYDPLFSTATELTTKVTTSTTKAPTRNTSVWRQNSNVSSNKQRPPLVLGFPPQRGQQIEDSREVQVKNAFRQDNSVIIQWDSDTSNILGFRVIYRLFGDKNFKQGPPLESTEREFKIKNVPIQECIIVCVVSLEEITVTPENVAHSQCREVRTMTAQTSNMDKITIAASAAICGTIIVAVIIFLAASRRRSKKLRALHSTLKNPLPIAGLPVNCCIPTPSPNLVGSLATLQVYNSHKDWDQVSTYSGRSIPRQREFQMNQTPSMADDLRSHHSHFTVLGSKMGKPRSIADGQSHQSFSNQSHRGYLNSGMSSQLISSRPELRQSRTSLTAASERMSRASYADSFHGGPHSVVSSTKRGRPRSRSKDQLSSSQFLSNRPGSRFSTTGSTHNLSNCYDTSDNWTDNDMEIYMTRNATARTGFVPL